MGQRSRPMPENITTNALWIDSGPYPADGRGITGGWEEKCYIENTGDPDTTTERTQLRGVIPTAWNKLVVTSTGANNITVESGAAWCHGTEFIFDDLSTPIPPLSFTVTSTSANPKTRQDRVVVVQNNTAADYSTNLTPWPAVLTDYGGSNSVPAYTTRIAILKGTEGEPGALPALVQTGDHWMIEIARYTIDDVGAITLTDQREFAQIEHIVGIHSADNTTDKDALIIGAEVDDTGVGAAGFGAAIRAKLDDAGGTLQDAGRMVFAWHTATAGAEVSAWKLYSQYIGNNVISGVIIAPQVASPDGNARGVGAVDLQGYRALATEVASGNYSVLCGGRENTASGLESFCGGGEDNEATGANSVVGGGNANIASGQTSTIAGGTGNQATNLNCTVGGGGSNQATGANNATVCGGTTNTATGNTDTVCGGSQNDATGGLGFIGGGSVHTCSAQSATIAGGFTNEASATGANVAGGRFNTASGGDSGIPGGSRALANKEGQIASASGQFAAAGDAQGTIQMVARATTAGGGAATTLYLDGAAQTIIIPADTAWTYDILVVAMRQNAAAVHSSRTYGVIYRDNAGNTTQASTTGIVVEQAGGGTTTVDTPGGADESLRIQFTDDGVNVYRAVATIRLSEVSYP